IRLARRCEFIYLRTPLFVWVRHAEETISRDSRRGIAGFQYVIDKHRDEIVRHHGIRAWSRLCLQNVVNALSQRHADQAREILMRMPAHSSRTLALAYARLGFIPRGGGHLLRLAARLPA